jgi:sterol desaturase/sphingolipid hydroxylase (fatty acid hydroxylase superfamily)
METYASVLTKAVILFMVLIIIEWVASIIMKKPVNRAMDTISSLSSGTTNTIKDMLKLSVVIISYQWLHTQFALFDIQSTTWLILLAFIGIDFASYWSHRWNHEFNLLWNRHIIHHSSEEFNLSAALRQSISGIFGIYFFLYLPMAIIGIPTKVIAIVAPLHLFAQFWYHTRLINKMGFLEKIIVTPSHHRVHHAINKEYLDKNYAAIFIIWDKWFGTFQEELENVPPVYGVKKPVQTWNPVIINFMHLWQLVKDAWRAEKIWDKVRIWFMPTGWRPEDVREKYPIEITERASDQIKYTTEASNFLIGWIWFQLALHIALEFHLISLLPDLNYSYLLYYGIFLLVSIFAYTTLMDRHPLAVMVEGIKTIIGFALIYSFNGWYGLDSTVQFATTLISTYLVLSLMLTVYFTYYEKIEPAVHLKS